MIVFKYFNAFEIYDLFEYGNTNLSLIFYKSQAYKWFDYFKSQVIHKYGNLNTITMRKTWTYVFKSPAYIYVYTFFLIRQ